MLVRKCRITGDRFTVSDAEQEHLRRMSEQNLFLKAALPLPTTKPGELARRYFVWGNLLTLFRSKSALSETSMLSRYNPEDGYNVVTIDEFWSDRVDNREFGRPYDFSRPFFEQFSELLRRVYHVPLSTIKCENSEYANGAENLKDCYLVFSGFNSRDCLYCLRQNNGSDSIDCLGTFQSQWCYECIDIDNCYGCQHCQDCWSCSECFGCFDCRSCRNCLGCVGLNNAEYHLFNQPLSRAEYERYIDQANLGSWTARRQALEQCDEFKNSQHHQPARIINCEGCSGSYIYRCKNIHMSYGVTECRDCGYLCTALKSTDCWKGVAFNSELGYLSGPVSARNIAYTYTAWTGESQFYCYNNYQRTAHCFGCAVLKNCSYCILNKQYSKAEYLELVPRIVQQMQQNGEWGEFFPPNLSPHAIDESYALAFVESLSDDEYRRRGYRVRGTAAPGRSASDIIEAEDLPERIADADESLLARPIRCELSGHIFKLQAKEIHFYRRQNIPLPRQHWQVRLRDKITRRDLNPDKLDVV